MSSPENLYDSDPKKITHHSESVLAAPTSTGLYFSHSSIKSEALKFAACSNKKYTLKL